MGLFDEKKVREAQSARAFIAGNTMLNEAKDVGSSRQQTFPPNGKLDLFQPWTGQPLHDCRGDFVLPQHMTYYKYPQLCLSCFGSRKKPLIGNYWEDRFNAICLAETCSNLYMLPYICAFSTEPMFTLRGLCKDAVMV